MGQCGVPLSWQYAQQKYSLISSLSFNWHALMRSFLKKWKDELLKNNLYHPGNNRNEKCNITSKSAYRRLLIHPLLNYQLFKIHLVILSNSANILKTSLKNVLWCDLMTAFAKFQNIGWV